MNGEGGRERRKGKRAKLITKRKVIWIVRARNETLNDRPMIRRGIDNSKECGSGLVKERTSERTNRGKYKRRNRMKRLKNERKNTRNASQTGMGPRGRGRTIIGGAQTMIKTRKNIERIPRKMSARIKHNRDSGIGNMVSMTRNRPGRRTAGRGDGVENPQVTVIMGTTNAIRCETLKGARSMIGQPSGNSHVKFRISGGQRIKLNESPNGVDKMGENRKGEGAILVDTGMLAKLGLDILLTSARKGASVKEQGAQQLRRNE